MEGVQNKVAFSHGGNLALLSGPPRCSLEVFDEEKREHRDGRGKTAHRPPPPGTLPEAACLTRPPPGRGLPSTCTLSRELTSTGQRAETCLLPPAVAVAIIDIFLF
jgi:hypothetical protein